MSDALTVRGLSKSYPGFDLRDVSFSLPEGYIMGFIGRNGAGKTTTIRLMLNMALRDAGVVSMFGRDGVHDEIAVKQDIGVVFDSPLFPTTWRVREVEPAIRPFYERWDAAAYADYLDRFDIARDKKVKDLSRGQLLKLMLASALSHDAHLLLLDEPTSGLDPVAREDLLDILRDYIADGTRSIFFSSHITSDLDKIADYITLLDGGRVLFTGAKDTLIESFAMVQGPAAALRDDLRSRLIAPAVTSTRFSGLLPSTDLGLLDPTMVAEPPSIDDVMVHVCERNPR